jgi:hypothetical protein
MLGGTCKRPLFYKKMIGITEILLFTRYALCVLLLIIVILAPAWIARQNGKGKPDMHAVRLGSWVFGWSIIAWVWSLFWATKK